jgi:hypothetical protein
VAFIKALTRGLLSAVALVAVNIFAQVSDVEGLTPVEGVVIPKANQSQSVKLG